MADCYWDIEIKQINSIILMLKVALADEENSDQVNNIISNIEHWEKIKANLQAKKEQYK